MIFNITSGGVAYISVSAPSGATVTASKDGMTFSQSSGVITVTSLGTWTVTCAYNITYKTHTVSVASFGSTQSVSFMDDYTSTIHVTTFPGASVVATQTGHSNLTGTANSSGVCDLTVPYDGLGDWIVTASFSSWSNSGMASFNSYGVTVNLVLDLSVPSFTYVTSGQAAYTFNQNSSTGSNSDYYFYKSGSNWEFYAKKSGTLTVNNKTVVDLFLLGGGNAGGHGGCSISRLWDGSRWVYWCSGVSGGTAGYGGTRKKHANVTLQGSYTVSIGSATSIGSYASNASGYSQSGDGANGGYCFDDANATGIDGNNYLVGAGGGHGASDSRNGTKSTRSTGGARGGGSGGDASASGGSDWSNSGSNGSYWGAGGGGGGAWGNENTSYDEGSRGGSSPGGSGYQGFAAIRNKR